MKYSERVAFGAANEERVFREHFADFERTERYHNFDFKRDNLFVEVKSRNCARDKYAETIVCEPKLNFIAEHPENSYKFVFLFTDGAYFIDYDAETFAGFRRGVMFDKPHRFIPVSALREL